MTLPLVRALTGAPSPSDACARLLDLPGCLLLESAPPWNAASRYSFVAADPFAVLRADAHGGVVRHDAAHVQRVNGDPFDAVRDALAAYATETVPGLPPFQGGAAGFLAYELHRHLERTRVAAVDDLGVPDLWLGLYDWVVAWDHERGDTWLISTGWPARTERGRTQRARERAAMVGARLARRDEVERPRPHDRRVRTSSLATYRVPGWPGVTSTFTRVMYLDAVERVIEYIRAGDVFQANVSQRFDARLPTHAFDFYRAWRHVAAAPFSAYVDVGDLVVVSASPERFLSVRGDRVETRPIKGTAARGTSAAADDAQRDALQRSEKDRAENVMIVDLLRNDLSRVCRDGSVQVPELLALETHGAVHHLVSTVVGRLAPDADAVAALRAAFPGGSITGAPKIRAVDIIAELEPTRRGVYTGAIGYLGFDGGMDTSVAIRTALAQGTTVSCSAGGGIVVDSEPEREYAETLDKARGFVEAWQRSEGG